MSKFRVKMKLTGLEMEIEGSREDAGLIARNMGQQFASLMEPIDSIVDGADVVDVTPRRPNGVVAPAIAPSKQRKHRRASATAGGGDASALDFRHDSAKFGNPLQSWKTAEKATWLIYVVKQSASVNEMTSRMIVDTFNKHFRGAGTITVSNVSRDLERSRHSERPSPLGFDVNASTWFLTDEGNRKALALVAAALEPST